MTEIYKHESQNRRILSYVANRMSEIDKAIEQMQMEKDLLGKILDTFKTQVCIYCCGASYIMEYEAGCEVDGPRMHTCVQCNGSGERQDGQ